MSRNIDAEALLVIIAPRLAYQLKQNHYRLAFFFARAFLSLLRLPAPLNAKSEASAVMLLSNKAAGNPLGGPHALAIL